VAIFLHSSCAQVLFDFILLQMAEVLCYCVTGCWDNPDNKECLPEPGCVARSPLSHPNIRNNTRFCCCRGNLCNVNVTDSVNFTAIDILSRQQAALDAAQYKSKVVPYLITIVRQGADPGFLAVSLQLTCHKPGGRLSLLSTRPTITFQAKEIKKRDHPLGLYQGSSCSVYWSEPFSSVVT